MHIHAAPILWTTQVFRYSHTRIIHEIIFPIICAHGRQYYCMFWLDLVLTSFWPRFKRFYVIIRKLLKNIQCVFSINRAFKLTFFPGLQSCVGIIILTLNVSLVLEMRSLQMRQTKPYGWCVWILVIRITWQGWHRHVNSCDSFLFSTINPRPLITCIPFINNTSFQLNTNINTATLRVEVWRGFGLFYVCLFWWKCFSFSQYIILC